MRVVVTGATGLIGRAAIDALLAAGDEPVALSRDAQRAAARLGAGVEVHAWPEPTRTPPPASALERADAVLHLLGEPIAQRWSERAKREIRDSRVLSTRSLLAGLESIPAAARPQTLVSQSAIGYYGPRDDQLIDETAGPGTDFLAGVTVAWEAAASAHPAGMRVVLSRTGVVLSPHGGALAKMLPPFRLGVGGPVAGGRQYVPWIHLDDLVGALLHCLAHERAIGPVNLTTPNPVTNAELSRVLGRVLHRPALVPVPGIALRAMFGEMASIVLTGQRAIPAKLAELGFEFRHPELEPALQDVLRG